MTVNSRPKRAPQPMRLATVRVVSAGMNRWVWLALVVAAVAGTLLFALLSPAGQRAGWSFLGGLALTVAAFAIGMVNIRFVDRYYPSLTLAAAMFSYLMTALALALVLAVSSPRVVDGPGISVGLSAGVVIWTAGLIALSWVRPEPRKRPVNIALHDEFPTNTS